VNFKLIILNLMLRVLCG